MRSIDRFQSTWLLPSLVLLGTTLAAPVFGQDLSRIRLAAGAAMTGDYRTGWGGHGLLEFSTSPGTRFDLRGSGSFAVGNFGPAGDPAFGLDVLGVVALGSGNRPYIGLGLGYSHTEFSARLPLAYDLGWSVAAGYEWRTWFVESRVRVFGNVFYERGSSKQFFLFSLGRSLGGG